MVCVRACVHVRVHMHVCVCSEAEEDAWHHKTGGGGEASLAGEEL